MSTLQTCFGIDPVCWSPRGSLCTCPRLCRPGLDFRNLKHIGQTHRRCTAYTLTNPGESDDRLHTSCKWWSPPNRCSFPRSMSCTRWLSPRAKTALLHTRCSLSPLNSAGAARAGTSGTESCPGSQSSGRQCTLYTHWHRLRWTFCPRRTQGKSLPLFEPDACPRGTQNTRQLRA